MRISGNLHVHGAGHVLKYLSVNRVVMCLSAVQRGGATGSAVPGGQDARGGDLRQSKAGRRL